MTTLIPTSRLLPLLDRFAQVNEGTSSKIDAGLARRIYKVRFEEEFVTFGVADRLLVDMDMAEEWHLSLADLFEHGTGKGRVYKGNGRMTPTQVRAAWRLYEAGYSTVDLSNELWRTLGFSSPNACRSALHRAFIGRPKRNLTEAGFNRWAKRLCAGCECLMDERTVGCSACHGRHNARKDAGLAYVPSPAWAGCRACGCALDNSGEGCLTCYKRHWRRALRTNKRAPVPTAPGLGGLSAGDAKRRGTDGGRFVPKTPPASLSRRGRSSLERKAA